MDLCGSLGPCAIRVPFPVFLLVPKALRSVPSVCHSSSILDFRSCDIITLQSAPSATVCLFFPSVLPVRINPRLLGWMTVPLPSSPFRPVNVLLIVFLTVYREGGSLFRLSPPPLCSFFRLPEAPSIVYSSIFVSTEYFFRRHITPLSVGDRSFPFFPTGPLIRWSTVQGAHVPFGLSTSTIWTRSF